MSRTRDPSLQFELLRLAESKPQFGLTTNSVCLHVLTQSNQAHVSTLIMILALTCAYPCTERCGWIKSCNDLAVVSFRTILAHVRTTLENIHISQASNLDLNIL